MLQNAYFLAKIGADTAENERHFAEILPKIGNYPTGRHRASVDAAARHVAGLGEAREAPVVRVQDGLLHGAAPRRA